MSFHHGWSNISCVWYCKLLYCRIWGLKNQLNCFEYIWDSSKVNLWGRLMEDQVSEPYLSVVHNNWKFLFRHVKTVCFSPYWKNWNGKNINTNFNKMACLLISVFQCDMQIMKGSMTNQLVGLVMSFGL